MSAASVAAVATTKIGRNVPCPCGSGKKFKHCCQAKDARDGLPPAVAESSPASSASKHELQALARAPQEHWLAARWVETIPLWQKSRGSSRTARRRTTISA